MDNLISLLQSEEIVSDTNLLLKQLLNEDTSFIKMHEDFIKENLNEENLNEENFLTVLCDHKEYTIFFIIRIIISLIVMQSKGYSIPDGLIRSLKAKL